MSGVPISPLHDQATNIEAFVDDKHPDGPFKVRNEKKGLDMLGEEDFQSGNFVAGNHQRNDNDGLGIVVNDDLVHVERQIHLIHFLLTLL